MRSELKVRVTLTAIDEYHGPNETNRVFPTHTFLPCINVKDGVALVDSINSILEPDRTGQFIRYSRWAELCVITWFNRNKVVIPFTDLHEFIGDLSELEQQITDARLEFRPIKVKAAAEAKAS
jgi:hypothetical protein